MHLLTITAGEWIFGGIVACVLLSVTITYRLLLKAPVLPENMQEDEDSCCPDDKRLHVDDNGLWEETLMTHSGYHYDPTDPHTYGV